LENEKLRKLKSILENENISKKHVLDKLHDRGAFLIEETFVDKVEFYNYVSHLMIRIAKINIISWE
jgi:hypothetical protein